ncbi:hypothetical protein V496_06155 [Pseudogymnoascus sp. VKM F-4515 (FW-2607)]|nr:hypothetical protein V496_06155 [Pseudogymnoascus sp. VKM F-4515 (FW-2607)]
MKSRTPPRTPPRIEQRRGQGPKRSGDGVVKDRKREPKRDVETMERGLANYLNGVGEGMSDGETEDDEDDRGEDGDTHHLSGDKDQYTITRKRKRDDEDDEESSSEEELDDEESSSEEEIDEPTAARTGTASTGLRTPPPTPPPTAVPTISNSPPIAGISTIVTALPPTSSSTGNIPSQDTPSPAQTNSVSTAVSPPLATSVSTAILQPPTNSISPIASPTPTTSDSTVISSAPATASPPTGNTTDLRPHKPVQSNNVSAIASQPLATSVSVTVGILPDTSVPAAVEAPRTTSVSVPPVVKAPPKTSAPAITESPPTAGLSTKIAPTARPLRARPPTARPPTARQPTATGPPVTGQPTARPPTTRVSTAAKTPLPMIPAIARLTRLPNPPPPPPSFVYFIRHTRAVKTYDHNQQMILLPDPALALRGHSQCAAIRAQFDRCGITHILTSPLKRTLETALHIFYPLPPNSPQVKVQIVPRLRPSPPLTQFNTPSDHRALRTFFSTGYYAQHRDAVDWSGFPAFPNHITLPPYHERIPALKRMLELLCSDAARERKELRVVVMGHGSSMIELFAEMKLNTLRSTEAWRMFRVEEGIPWNLVEVTERGSM